ncbi:MAG TPA: ergothioneine biosynthesis protein EgtB, partial [Pseudomonas sp.]|nr:ergothioneine biosynthesis protein EgtB [Pseudomonas sp.]
MDHLLQRFQQIRATSEAICAPLQIEDYVIQSMPDVSPPKWHLAHISWFFEAFLLKPYLPGYKPLNAAYDHLFNSYYETHSTPFPRVQRGLISRPGVEDVYRFRQHVDRAMGELLTHPPQQHAAEIMHRVELGLQHEQQHQELLLMDIKHILAQNPLHPVYRSD